MRSAYVYQAFDNFLSLHVCSINQGGGVKAVNYHLHVTRPQHLILLFFFINIYVDDFMAFGRYMRRTDICDTWRTLHMMEDNGLYRVSPMLLFLSLDISLWLCTKFCCVDGASPREIQISYIPHSGG